MDEEILQIADKDKEKGFRCLIERYQEPLYWHVRRMLPGHDDAEDVLQETFLRAYKHWGSFKGSSKLSTWLYKIATNEALRFLEKNKHTLLPLDDLERVPEVEWQDNEVDAESIRNPGDTGGDIEDQFLLCQREYKEIHTEVL